MATSCGQFEVVNLPDRCFGVWHGCGTLVPAHPFGYFAQHRHAVPAVYLGTMMLRLVRAPVCFHLYVALTSHVSWRRQLKAVHIETFGKTGCRRIVPGQYLAADPQGRAIMISAVEKQKLVGGLLPLVLYASATTSSNNVGRIFWTVTCQ